MWLVDYLEVEMASRMGSIGADIGAVLLMAGLGDAIAIIIASWSVAVQLKVLRGTFKGFKVA